MFDFAWSEFALIGIVGLLFIGPKDMPVAIRTVTTLLKKGRKLAGEFQSHVDEMVREADLGEARTHLNQLRSFNVRGQIMKALDEDGSIRRTVDGTRGTAAGLMAATGPTGAAPEAAAFVPPITATVPVGTRPLHGMPAPLGDHSWHTPEPDPVAAEAAAAERERLDRTDPAPVILPPAIAARLQAERARPRAPSFLPPRSLHPRPARGSPHDPDFRPVQN